MSLNYIHSVLVSIVASTSFMYTGCVSTGRHLNKNIYELAYKLKGAFTKFQKHLLFFLVLKHPVYKY